MVSMSITSMLRKPDSARFLRISHPRPPAPITSNLAVSLIAVIEGSPGMKDSSVYAPGRERKLSRYFHFALLESVVGIASGCMTAAMMVVVGVGLSDSFRGQSVEGLQVRRCSEDGDGVNCKRV